jgi:hypothetical protein
MFPKPEEASALPAPPRRCPFCGSVMRIADRGAYVVSYVCSPCRVTAQYPAEPLPDER